MAGLAGLAGAAQNATPLGAAAGALKSLTGGHAGPSTATSRSAFDLNNHISNGFTGGDLNMGSPRGFPIWLIAAIGFFVFILFMSN